MAGSGGAEADGRELHESPSLRPGLADLGKDHLSGYVVGDDMEAFFFVIQVPD